jgi:uncharacterized protein YdhG (YjbR/CyaY superfamily)
MPVVLTYPDSRKPGAMMDSQNKNITTIDDYIAAFPDGIQIKLRKLRAAIHDAAPDALEKISYGMPTFYLNGNLVHFAAFKNHIGFYPAPSGIEAYQEELAKYQTSKGAVQFPLDKPLPIGLIQEIVRFRVVENMKKAGR